jgi:SAM-dependent methyltransferase
MIDKNYWHAYYLNKQNKKSDADGMPTPSAFCSFVLSELPKHVHSPPRILDAGCGNGRDTYALGGTGMDSSGFLPQPTEHAQFVTGDFTTGCKDAYNVVYSRFTYHSITNEQQESFLSSIRNTGTVLCIETRSDKSKDDARVTGDGHYRNFTHKDTLHTQLLAHDFDVLYIYEGNGVAVYKEEDPVCIRVIAVKR